MIEIEDLSDREIEELLSRVGYGHLACSINDDPYVVPVHFAYRNRQIFVYTTDGKKSHIIDQNPRVCLQAEEVVDNQNWESVIVTGVAEKIIRPDEREAALAAITKVNPTLTPAVSIHWLDNWIRENIEVVFRITPVRTTGRRAVPPSPDSPDIVPGNDRGRGKIY